MLYSILPASVALYFLIAGLIVHFRFSSHRSHVAFIILCITTFSWQFTWAILFQVRDPVIADIIIKTGYLLIIFLPTSIYHFLIEISRSHKEKHYVYYSYAIASILAIALLTSDLIISGHYEYFFGFYPKAGSLHILHVLQTAIVTLRGLYLVYQKQNVSSGLFKSQLRFCLLSIVIYILAAVDYLCNYGIEFYPPGIFFITIGLSIFLYALLKMELMTSFHQVFTKQHEEKINLLKTLAANIAHELRTPLATIQMDAKSAKSQATPYLLDNIINTTQHANIIINMLLANLRSKEIDTEDFQTYSANYCIHQALESYPFHKDEKMCISYKESLDFDFRGSDTMLIYVIYNLLNNALYFIAKATKGNIEIWLDHSHNTNYIHFKDTGSGIPKHKLQYIFNDFYSSKPDGVGNGLGLGFCDRAMNSFGGSIEVNSIEDQYTHFTLSFPGIDRR
ncbi:MAG: ATP-binding protein [Gammaproteobacteria bacterium]